MAKRVIVISRYVTSLSGDLIPEIMLTPINGISYTMVTPQVDGDLDSGDPCLIEVGGLSNAQLTAAKERADAIYITDRDDDGDWANDIPPKAELQQIANKLASLFNVPPAKIQKWVDTNGKPTRKELWELINKLSLDGKTKKTKGVNHA